MPTTITFTATHAPSGLVGAIISDNGGTSADLVGWYDKLLVAFPLPVYATPS
jgi:hypothetical protein